MNKNNNTVNEARLSNWLKGLTEHREMIRFRHNRLLQLCISKLIDLK